jgi:hypothetical protein
VLAPFIRTLTDAEVDAPSGAGMAVASASHSRSSSSSRIQFSDSFFGAGVLLPRQGAYPELAPGTPKRTEQALTTVVP